MPSDSGYFSGGRLPIEPLLHWMDRRRHHYVTETDEKGWANLARAMGLSADRVHQYRLGRRRSIGLDVADEALLQEGSTMLEFIYPDGAQTPYPPFQFDNATEKVPAQPFAQWLEGRLEHYRRWADRTSGQVGNRRSQNKGYSALSQHLGISRRTFLGYIQGEITQVKIATVKKALERDGSATFEELYPSHKGPT